MSKQFQSIAILGRQPALGLAELESLYGPDVLSPFGNHALLTIPHEDIDYSRLGGTVRIAKILRGLPSNWRAIEQELTMLAPKHAEYIDGKLTFGLSVYGMKIHKKDVARTALNIKKAIKKSGHSVRMVPHDGVELNAATVLYNKLTGPQGWELLVVSDGKKTYLAQTASIQDIDAYAARDRERPMRDAKVGMLPPKLAQIIINLAKNKEDINPQSEHHLLDPFCGTGVLIQEALLMGYFVHGSDIDQRMIDYALENINWLYENFDYPGTLLTVRQADATGKQWIEANILASVACETYLGQPLSTLPPSDQLSKIMTEVNTLHHKFLENIGKQITSGTRLCLAIPAWRGNHEFLHLKVLDYLDDLGYTRMKFKHVENKDLIYHRDNQVVGRELLVLEKR